MAAATLFVHNVVLEKLSWELSRNEDLKLQWILNFIRVIDISGWLNSLQFLSVTLPVIKIKPRLFYRVVKKLGRPRPLTKTIIFYMIFERDACCKTKVTCEKRREGLSFENAWFNFCVYKF